MTTNTEHRRRETDKIGPFIQQAALDKANARIAELEESQKWRPISTAKESSTADILILLRNGRIVVAFWSDLWSRWKSDSDRIICNPTHWMPLPTPPAEKQGE